MMLNRTNLQQVDLRSNPQLLHCGTITDCKPSSSSGFMPWQCMTVETYTTGELILVNPWELEVVTNSDEQH
jgi:hypothetical protein|eukprot:10098-Heterococcus_DN1.PRE.2